MACNSPHCIPFCVLIDTCGYDTVRRDATTAWSETSKGEPISVSFSSACPPTPSHLAISMPDRPATNGTGTMPRVVNADAGLFVLCVPSVKLAGFFARHKHDDYFVYKAASASRPKPELHRLPKLEESFNDEEVAVLSCGDDGNFVVAILRNKDWLDRTFTLHLYRSTTGCWTSTEMPMEDPLRDMVYPIPDPDDGEVPFSGYHVTRKAITLGGDEGTVGWVDLWRGIILCDVLSESPELEDIPLPTGISRHMSRSSDPLFCRDICVDQQKTTIKYVQMSISVREVPVKPSSDSRNKSPRYTVVPGPWKATVYTMPIQDASWFEWRRERSIRSADLKLPVDDTECCETLRKLVSSSEVSEEETTACLSLDCLQMGWPVLSVVGDDTIVYLLSQSITSTLHLENMKAIVAVDMGKGAVKEAAMIHTSRHFYCRRSYLASWIPRVTTGARASDGRAEEHVEKAERDMSEDASTSEL